MARLHLLPGIYAARGVYTALDAVGNAIGDTASAVSNFFGFGGSHATPAAVNPAHGRSLMRVIDSPSPQFGPNHYPDDLPSSRSEVYDGTQESQDRITARGVGAFVGLAIVTGAWTIDGAIGLLTGSAVAAEGTSVAAAGTAALPSPAVQNADFGGKWS